MAGAYAKKKISEQREKSMLTFETEAVQGVTGIIEKLKVLKGSKAMTSMLIH